MRDEKLRKKRLARKTLHVTFVENGCLICKMGIHNLFRLERLKDKMPSRMPGVVSIQDQSLPWSR